MTLKKISVLIINTLPNISKKKEMKILQETKRFVQQTLVNAEGGHDWFHIERVWKNA